MSTPIAHREWVDWSQPFVPAAARWLRRIGATRPGICSFEGVLCITPGRRSGRVILEALLRDCERDGVALLPPRMATPGALPDAVVCPAEPLATATPDECRLAWIEALQRCDAETIRPLVPRPPSPSDLLAWNSLAAIIQSLHEELSGGMLRFGQVADRAAAMELFGESERWTALERVFERYLDVLSSASLRDAHEARTERLARPPSDRQAQPDHIILIGVPELNAVHRAALALAPQVSVLIHGPANLTDAFDELGCVIPEAWAQRTIDLRDEQIVVTDQPDDQCQAILRVLATAHSGAAVDTVTIGLGDEALGEAIDRAAEWAGISIHRAEGTKLARSGPYRLLSVICNWLAEERFAPFAALLRHPDVERWLFDEMSETEENIHDWITLLDRYFADHLHKRFAGKWLGRAETRTRLKRTYDAICSLTSALRFSATRRLAEWIPPTLDVLNKVYFDSPNEDNRTAAAQRDACLAIRDRLESFAEVTERLQPQCDAATALALFLEACSGETLAAQPRHDQIEALGWLELHLDAAPNVLLMGVNDGCIPQSITSDQFLPNALREALNLRSASSRYARDAYLLDAINRSRKLNIVTGRRGADGEPLTPSRLLFACEPDRLPARVLHLAGDSAVLHWPVPMGAPAPVDSCEFAIYQPPQVPQSLDRMRVTAFRQYLQCPYRWYLANIAKLASTGDEADELDPLAFGTLAHVVLQHLANDESIRDSKDAERIFEFIRDRLAREATKRYGDHPPPALRIQLDRLAHRFAGFARFQARTRAEGWRIVECEYKLENCTLDIPGEDAVIVTGTIDRIDHHEERGYRIIDYKTGDSGESPMKAHHGREKYDVRWLDLQLPLYKHLAAQCGYGGEVQLGYIILPKDSDAVNFRAAAWTAEQLDEAVETAREVVRAIRAGRFPMSDDVESAFDEFANICQTSVLGRASHDNALEAAT